MVIIRLYFGALKVCDLYCGGVDAEKWDGAQIGHYIGIGTVSNILGLLSNLVHLCMGVLRMTRKTS